MKKSKKNKNVIWNFLKNIFKSSKKHSINNDFSQENDFQWHDIGKDNPFNKRFLDVRSFTQTMLSTTSDENIARKYLELRNSMGKEYIGSLIENETDATANLNYNHNGEQLEGAVFKSNSMECKWDIYAYNNFFYFVRSWTGIVEYKAKFAIYSDKLVINRVYYNREINKTNAMNDIHFLMKSHAIGIMFPHQIPKDLTNKEDIAFYSFSRFGNIACFATYDDLLNI